MDWNAAKVLLDFVSLIFAIGACLYAWRVKRGQADQDQIDKLKDDNADLKERMSRFDARLNAVPGPSEFAKISERMGSVDGEIKALRAEIQGVRELLPGLQNAVNMLNQYLLNAKS